jgi:hypothetical protein
MRIDVHTRRDVDPCLHKAMGEPPDTAKEINPSDTNLLHGQARQGSVYEQQ